MQKKRIPSSRPPLQKGMRPPKLYADKYLGKMAAKARGLTKGKTLRRI